MEDGLYLAQFAIGSTVSNGVVMKAGRAISGGDSSHWWEGRLEETGADEISAEMTVRPHSSGKPSVFGFFDEYPLAFKGKLNGNAWQFLGSSPIVEERPVTLCMTRLKAD